MEKPGILRNISLVEECPSDKYTIRGWFLTISVDEIHQKCHTFGFFGQILLETVCLKIYLFINKSGVLRGYAVIPRVPIVSGYLVGYPGDKHIVRG